MKGFSMKLTRLLVNKYIILTFTGAATGIFILFYLSYSEESLSSDFYNQTGFAMLGAALLIAFEKVSQVLDGLISWRHNTGYRILVGMLAITAILIGSSVVLMKVFPPAQHQSSQEADGTTFQNPSDRNGRLPEEPPLDDLPPRELSLEEQLLDGPSEEDPDFRGPSKGRAEDTVMQMEDQLLIKVAILSVIFSLIYSIVYFARYSYRQFAVTQVETIRQERKQIDLQLKALKSQLGPHFLFNSLNAISSLIYQKGADAENFVRKLAHNYQYLIDSYEKRLVTLREELNFAIAYHHLLKTRVGEQLAISYDLSDETMRSRIPPVTLQMLVENAVKHNLLAEEYVLKIHISEEKEYLVVSNNITKPNPQAVSNKIGLENINSRYELLAEKGIEISAADHFQVKLPLIA